MNRLLPRLLPHGLRRRLLRAGFALVLALPLLAASVSAQQHTPPPPRIEIHGTPGSGPHSSCTECTHDHTIDSTAQRSAPQGPGRKGSSSIQGTGGPAPQGIDLVNDYMIKISFVKQCPCFFGCSSLSFTFRDQFNNSASTSDSYGYLTDVTARAEYYPGAGAYREYWVDWSYSGPSCGSSGTNYVGSATTLAMKPPVNVSVSTGGSDANVSITWSKGTDHPDQFHTYRIYRNGVFVASVNGSTRSWSGTQLPGQTNTWTVRSRSFNGSESVDASGTATTAVFKVPQSFTASDSTYADYVLLSWSNISDHATAFRIYRNGVLIATVPRTSASSYTYEDRTAIPDRSYTYSVRSYNAPNAQESAASTDAGSQYPILPVASNGEFSNRVKITWYNQSAKVDQVRISRDNDELVTMNANGTTTYDYDGIPGRLYRYRVAQVRQGTELASASAYGFIRRNGRLEGRVLSKSRTGVEGVTITAIPTNPAMRRSASFNGAASLEARKRFEAVSNNFTIEFWARPSASRPSTAQATNGSGGLVGQRYAVAPVSLESDAAGTGSAVGVSVGTNGISVFERMIDGSGGVTGMPSPLVHDTALSSAAWVHVAVVYENRVPTLYINGVWARTGLQSTRPSVAPGHVLGNYNALNGYSGLLDEVRVWNAARTAEDIRGTMLRELAGTESGLAALWNFNDGMWTSAVAGDAVQLGGRHADNSSVTQNDAVPEIYPRTITDATGFFSFRGLYYGDEAEWRLVPDRNGRRTYDPDTLRRTIDFNAPIAGAIEFIDTASFGIEGIVEFTPINGDRCPAAGVEIVVNGRSLGVTTDSLGRFATSVDQVGVYTFEPFYEGHVFNPPSITMTVNDHVRGPDALRFTDSTMRRLSLRARGGSLACNIPLGRAQVSLQALGLDGRSTTLCAQRLDSTDINGNYSILLPAQRYRLTLTHLHAPFGALGRTDTRMLDFRQDSANVKLRTGPDDVMIRWASVEDTLRFNYHAPPTITVGEFGDQYCGTTVLDQGVRYVVPIDVEERYVLGGVEYTCPLDTGIVIVYDGIGGDVNTPDTLIVRNGVAWTDFDARLVGHQLIAGEPNIFANGINPSLSFKKRLYASAISYGHSAVSSPDIWAVVRGVKTRTQTFVTKTPELPMLILRDPPGDQSYSYLQKDSSFTLSYKKSFESGGAAGGFINAKVGSGGDIPFVGKLGGYGRLAGSLKAGRVNYRDTTTVITWSASETISTSNVTKSSGKGEGDVVMGASLNVTYALADVVDFNTATCTIIRDTTLAWGNQGFGTTYMYTISHIRNVIIPQLTTLRDIIGQNTSPRARDSVRLFNNYINVWNQVVQKNDSLKLVAGKKRNLSFSAGAPYSYEFTSETSRTIDYSYQIAVDWDIAVSAGLVVGDFTEIEAGVLANARWSVTTDTSLIATSGKTIGYHLEDDDEGDFFSVDVCEDPAYGTPVFRLVAGTSSCPWEPGTQSRDGAFFGNSAFPKTQLDLDRYMAVDILPDEQAAFVVSITNTSESGEARNYMLSVDQMSNIDGAVISIGGVNIERGLEFRVPPGITRKATLTVGRGPIAYDYEDIALVLSSTCDANISSRVEFGVKFLTPCSKVTLVEPIENWVVNATNDNVLEFILTDLEKDKIGDDLEVQYRKIGSQKWLAAMTISKNRIEDQKFKFVTADWVIPPTITDGVYELRVKVTCSSLLGGGITYSNVVRGVINRTAMQVFGVPEPKDGVLHLGDEISVSFTDPVDCPIITPDNVIVRYTDTQGTIPSDSIQIVCTDRNIVIRPLVADRLLQGRTLEVTVRDVKNITGNGLPAPVVWSFIVNRRSLVWEPSNVSGTGYAGSSMTLTGLLRNRGVRVETFSMRPTQWWLQPVTTAGSIAPSGQQIISFLVSNLLLPGEYRDTVVVETADGDERLYVSVTVLHQPPAWRVNTAYPHVMSVTANYMLDSTLSTDPNDLIAAFVGNECRGVASIQFVPSINDHLAFVTVYGAESTPAEIVTFKVWDASTGKIHAMIDSYPFDPSTSRGSLFAPVILRPAGVEQVIPLGAGWTWFSLNTVAPNMSPTAVFSRSALQLGDQLKSATGYSQWIPVTGWSGSIDTLRPGRAYKVRLAAPTTLLNAGVPVRSDLALPLPTGWSWLGYLPSRQIGLNEALASLLPSPGDRLKSQTGYAEFTTATGWLGSLQVMRPGEGYMIRITTPGTLQYPLINNFLPSGRPGEAPALHALAAPGAVAEMPGWSVNPAQYEYSMTVTGAIVPSDRGVHPASRLAAFAGDVCRGVAVPQDVLGRTVYFLMIHGNTAGDPITLRLYDGELDSVLAVDNAFIFASDAAFGDPVSPHPLRLTGTATSVDGAPRPDDLVLEQNYPNPFNPSTVIRFALPRDAHARLAVYDALGNEVRVLMDERRHAGTYEVRFDASTLRSGTYVYRLSAENRELTRRMVLVK